MSLHLDLQTAGQYPFPRAPSPTARKSFSFQTQNPPLKIGGKVIHFSSSFFDTEFWRSGLHPCLRYFLFVQGLDLRWGETKDNYKALKCCGLFIKFLIGCNDAYAEKVSNLAGSLSLLEVKLCWWRIKMPLHAECGTVFLMGWWTLKTRFKVNNINQSVWWIDILVHPDISAAVAENISSHFMLTCQLSGATTCLHLLSITIWEIPRGTSSEICFCGMNPYPESPNR